MWCSYLGSDDRSYPAHRDAATGRMLYAAPGGTYDVQPAADPVPVPPNDGRWEAAEPPAGDPPGDGAGDGTPDAAALLAELEQHQDPGQVTAELQADLTDSETPAPEGAPAPESEE